MCAAAKISRFAVADVNGLGGAVAKFGVHLPPVVIGGTEYKQFTVLIGPDDFIGFVDRSPHRGEIGEMLGFDGFDGLRRLVASSVRIDASALGRQVESKIGGQLGSMPIDRCW